jgi:hypothetical protein
MLCVTEGVPVNDAVSLAETDVLREGVLEPEGEPERDGVVVTESVRLGDGENSDGEAVAVNVPVVVGLGENSEGVMEGLYTLCVTDGVPVLEAVWLKDADKLYDMEAVPVGVPEVEGVWV